MQEGNLFEETLQIAEEREVKSKGELHAEFQRIARRDKKASSMNSAKK